MQLPQLSPNAARIDKGESDQGGLGREPSFPHREDQMTKIAKAQEKKVKDKAREIIALAIEDNAVDFTAALIMATAAMIRKYWSTDTHDQVVAQIYQQLSELVHEEIRGEKGKGAIH